MQGTPLPTRFRRRSLRTQNTGARSSARSERWSYMTSIHPDCRSHSKSKRARGPRFKSWRAHSSECRIPLGLTLKVSDCKTLKTHKNSFFELQDGFFSKESMLCPGSLVARIWPCRGQDPGSIPGLGVLTIERSEMVLILIGELWLPES